MGLGVIDTSLALNLDNTSSIPSTKGGLFCKNPLFKLAPFGALKLVIEIASPVLIVSDYPSCFALKPAMLIVNGVIDCPFDLEKLKKNIKNKNPLLIKTMLVIHLGQLKVAE